MVELELIDFSRLNDRNIAPRFVLNGLRFEEMAHHAFLAGFIRVDFVTGGAGFVIRHTRFTSLIDLMTGDALHALVDNMDLMGELEEPWCIGALGGFEYRWGIDQPIADTV